MYGGKFDMRIRMGIPMPWEMFPAGQDAMIVESCNCGSTHSTHLIWLGSKCSIANDRIGRIGVDIQNRGHIHVYADAS